MAFLSVFHLDYISCAIRSRFSNDAEAVAYKMPSSDKTRNAERTASPTPQRRNHKRLACYFSLVVCGFSSLFFQTSFTILSYGSADGDRGITVRAGSEKEICASLEKLATRQEVSASPLIIKEFVFPVAMTYLNIKLYPCQVLFDRK
jgi:hypothetical protein